ncbi:MAG: MBL fold metallo-hydrolase [Flavobacteriales bacterium]|jgi:phosphoribosyl 1,2-cyclic phosphate phosphodiesterase|nr:MBL fold metallo-hydrolase [Flavobacteriales bacterium]
MRITFLGTGTSQGVPIIACDCEVCRSKDEKDKRLRSSIMLEDGDDTFVIDTGPDFRQQMLRENVKNLTAIIYTHEHKDHLGGMDDVRAFNFILKKDINLYATQQVQEAIKNDFHYAFADYKYPGVPLVNLVTIDSKPFVINSTKFIPIEVVHHKLPVLGFRIKDFAYITDANYISEKEKQKLKGVKTLVLNALRRKEHISHFTLEEAIDLMNEINPEKGYLTHISHQLGTHADVSKELPSFVELGYDGLRIEA